MAPTPFSKVLSAGMPTFSQDCSEQLEDLNNNCENDEPEEPSSQNKMELISINYYLENPCDEPCSSIHKRIDFKMLMRLRQAALEQVFTVRRLGEPSQSQPWNPDFSSGKCTAVVRFRVNRPINVESFGFFGPHEAGGRGKYHMEISLLTENYCEISSTKQLTPVIKNNDIFHVKFDNPVPILPCIWYMAKFSLMGPPTSQSFKIVSQSRILCGDFGDANFLFEMPDSNQLPEIGFSIRA